MDSQEAGAHQHLRTTALEEALSNFGVLENLASDQFLEN